MKSTKSILFNEQKSNSLSTTTKGFAMAMALGVMAVSGTVNAAAVNLNDWGSQNVNASVSGTWMVQWPGQDSVLQTQNSEPTVFYEEGTTDQGYKLSGKIQVTETSEVTDDDIIGFVLGLDTGEIGAASADFILVDWKQTEQNYSGYGGVAKQGLAISHVSNASSTNSFWTHSGGVTEIARGVNLGSTGWVDNQPYSFELVFTAELIQVWVDTVLELSITPSDVGITAFNDGAFGFYNLSQKDVLYSEIKLESLVTSPPLATACVNGTPIVAGVAVTTLVNGQIRGNIVSSSSVTMGVNTATGGQVLQAGSAVTTGAGTEIIGDIRAGTAITLGAGTIVSSPGTGIGTGDVCAGTALTVGAGATYTEEDCLTVCSIAYTNNDTIDAQAFYNSLTALAAVDRNPLPTTVPLALNLDGDSSLTNRIIVAGRPTVVYNGSALTTAAGVTITLMGDYDWVFNTIGNLTFGAHTKIEMAPSTSGYEGSVTWNTGGFASVGADAAILGPIFANGYIVTGADSTVSGAPSDSVPPYAGAHSYCGGLYSARSYASVGIYSLVACDLTTP